MKSFFISSLMILSLIGCASSKESRQITKPDDSSPAISEEVIPTPAKTPEVKKVKVAKPGIDPLKVANGVANGIADLWVDGELESDSLDKENPVHVLIDDVVETTAEHMDTEKSPQDRKHSPVRKNH